MIVKLFLVICVTCNSCKRKQRFLQSRMHTSHGICRKYESGQGSRRTIIMIEKISEMKKALDEVLKNGISSMKCYCEMQSIFYD